MTFQNLFFVTGVSALIFCTIQCSAITLAFVLLRRARTRYYGARPGEVDAAEQVSFSTPPLQLHTAAALVLFVREKKCKQITKKKYK